MIDYKKIKVLAIDVDGTYSDGIYYTGSVEGYRHVILKAFHTRDSEALSRAVDNGLNIVFLTGSNDGVIEHKLRQIPSRVSDQISIVECEGEKIAYLMLYMQAKGLVFDDMAYIGDSYNDLEPMKQCALTACPSDSVSIIKEEANYVCDNPGGRGAVCEFIDYILEMKENGD